MVQHHFIRDGCTYFIMSSACQISAVLVSKRYYRPTSCQDSWIDDEVSAINKIG